MYSVVDSYNYIDKYLIWHKARFSSCKAFFNIVGIEVTPSNLVFTRKREQSLQKAEAKVSKS